MRPVKSFCVFINHPLATTDQRVLELGDIAIGCKVVRGLRICFGAGIVETIETRGGTEMVHSYYSSPRIYVPCVFIQQEELQPPRGQVMHLD